MFREDFFFRVRLKVDQNGIWGLFGFRIKGSVFKVIFYFRVFYVVYVQLDEYFKFRYLEFGKLSFEIVELWRFSFFRIFVVFVGVRGIVIVFGKSCFFGERQILEIVRYCILFGWVRGQVVNLNTYFWMIAFFWNQCFFFYGFGFSGIGVGCYASQSFLCVRCIGVFEFGVGSQVDIGCFILRFSVLFIFQQLLFGQRKGKLGVGENEV